MTALRPTPPAKSALAAATSTSNSLLRTQRGSAADVLPLADVADVPADEPAATAEADCEGRRPDRLALPDAPPEAADFVAEAVPTTARSVTPFEMEVTVSEKRRAGR